MLDFGGAVLDYDREYCFIHCVFFFYPLTHVFRMTGRQLFTLVVDGLQELMKVILLLKLFSIYCHSKIFSYVLD